MTFDKRRRWFMTVAGTLVVIVVLAACGNSSSSSTPALGSAATSTATTASAAAPSPAGEMMATPESTMTEGTPMAEMGPAMVMVHNDSMYGPVLTNSHGMTLYVFTHDMNGESTCTGTCATTWPPLLTHGTPAAGSGVTGKLGTTTRSDGSTQVTYNGMPLYTYARDMASGEAHGQGVGGVWFVATPTGMATPSS